MKDLFDSMRRHIKNTLIPHEGNDHCPHLVRGTGIFVLSLVLALAFGFSIFQGLVINRGSDFIAAILPAVLVDLANSDRTDDGLQTLTVNPLLEEAARMKAEHMAENGYFAHVSPDGLDPWYWFYRAGYDFVQAGENLAVNFSDSGDVERAWMDSPGHRANILNAGYTEIGIAAARGTYKGRETIFVVQMFGRPSAAQVAVDRVATAPESTGTLIKEDVTARVEGVVAAETVSRPTRTTNVESASVSFWDSAASRPRATVSWVYVAASLLLSFVLLCMVFRQVHRRHTRSVVYGVMLLVLIMLLSYLNTLLLSSELVII